MTLHRLNRAEFDNTVRDLLGDRSAPAQTFPADNPSAGFDNVASVLTLSPLLFEKYATAAEQLVQAALTRDASANPRTLVTCDAAVVGAEPCAREVLTTFARRAWRRPPSAEELAPFQGTVRRALAEGVPFEQGLGLALEAVLLSPRFLFRIELDPEPESTAPHPLDPHELASRLSYFLWSSLPDERLLELAESGRLQEPEVLEEEVQRMLRDPRAEALVQNFAGQWLDLRSIPDALPDPQRFPGIDAALKADLRTESERFVRALMSEEHSILRLLSAEFTFLNDRLASHYALPTVGSTEHVQVPVAAPRGGLLTHGGLLMLTSHPDRTSPVKRGRWVLSQLLCSEPPPPPPEVEGLLPEIDPDATVRERVEAHRADPACAGCHALMDPIGFGLENFDAVGRYRTTENGAPVDASGTLPSGQTFSSARELSALIEGEPAFPLCLTRQLFTYALGRLPEPSDECALRHLAHDFSQGEGRFSDLVLRLVRLPAFTHRRGEAKGTP